MATFSRRFDADHHTLSTVRGALRSWLDVQADDAVTSDAAIGDIDLVVTELAANVIDHSGSSWVDIAVTISTSGLEVGVTQSGDATGLPDTTAWGTATAGDRGHGLRIVEALCSEVTIERDGATTSVRCRILS